MPTNHVHLLLTPGRAESVPRVVIAIGRRYVQYTNQTDRRTLWDSRYKASLVEAETDLLVCQRDIELNPVRAGRVRDPGADRGCSDRHHALGQPDPMLSPHPPYLALAPDAAACQRGDRELFAGSLDDGAIADLGLALKQNHPIGNPRVYAAIEAATGQRRALKKGGHPPKARETAPSMGNRGSFRFDN